MGSESSGPTEDRTYIDEMYDKEEFYRKGEEYVREVFRREEKVKYETGKRIIEGVRREYGERCLNILTDLNVDYDFLEEKREDAKSKMRELFKPLSDIKIAGRYVFKEVAENIDKIDSWYEGTFEVDYEYKSKKLEKEIERIRRDAIGLIEKKYDLIEEEEVGEEEKIRVGKEEAKRIIERYFDGESERRECRRILDDNEKSSIKIEDRIGYCSSERNEKKKNNDPILKAMKKAIKANDWRSVAFLSRGCSLASDISIESNGDNYSLFGYSCKVNSIECAVYLLKKGGGIEKRFEEGGTPLSESIKGRNENVARFLIGRGADIRVKDSRGHSMLHCAAESDCYEIAEVLIERGANIEEKDNDGETPLHYAAWKNSIEIVKLLIERGANIDEKDTSGWTPLHLAAYNNSIDVVKLLIKKGANTEERDNNRRTPLHCAAYNNSIEVGKYLIDNGVNIEEKDNDGETPFHCVSDNNVLGIAEDLIEKGLSVKEKDSKGRTPLHYAAYKNSIEIAKLLIDKKANIDEKDNKGRTPLHLAAYNNSIEFAKLLNEKGANVGEKDNEGKTPLQLSSPGTPIKRILWNLTNK